MNKTVYLAGGCFWGMQKFFDQFPFVKNTCVGYANGPEGAPTYEEVCHDSGHAETVMIEYDGERTSLNTLLDYFFMAIDPFSVNKQGEDRGIQYRTGIYLTDEESLRAAREYLDNKEKELGKKTAVECCPLRDFYPAEEYHQKYLDKNPGGYCHLGKEMFKLYSEE